LSGNVAIVTGAAGAIGSAVAEQLLRNGASVCICDIGGINRIMGGEDRDGGAPPSRIARQATISVSGRSLARTTVDRM
jgi:NAD(P)-dependent dehydrogenase (short-subunit alcohol dehydrogenase family)